MTVKTVKTFSPYACAGIVNVWLAEDGIQKKLPPQMFYQYVSKGYIGHAMNEKGKKVVTEEQLANWYAVYTKKAVEVVEETEEVVEENIVVDGVDIDDEQTVLFA